MVKTIKFYSHLIFFSLFILICSFKETPLYSDLLAESSIDVPISAELISEIDSIQPGKPFWVAVRLKMQDSWHSYWKNPGEVGMPTSIEWNLPEGYSVSPILWPTPERFSVESIVGYGYENQAILLAEITPPNHQNASTSLIGASIQWLACSNTTCQPGTSDIALSLPVNISSPHPNEIGVSLIKEAKRNLPAESWGELSASRKHNLVEIILNTSELQALPLMAIFFPENPNLIDSQIEATITHTDKNTYIIALKENELAEEKPTEIKGILVLKEKETMEIVKALDINIPLSNSSKDGLLSMNDVPQKNDNSSEELKTSPFTEGFFFYLITGFIGGIILNLMPCVLPVISLKIMNFVKLAGEEKSKILLHGIAFSLGVLVSFWFLAGVLILLQTYGHSVGWGFQLQQPFVIALLTIVILVFGLSMFGVFEFGTSFAAWAGQKTHSVQQKDRESSLSSFMGGVLATAMATPCTGPFLGPAVGFAATQAPIFALLIFTSLGLGMASPYLLLSAFPNMLRFLPKPGKWMVTFREITGFIMLTVVLWLLWVFAAQTDSIALFLLMATLLVFALGCWIYGKWATPYKSKRVRILGTIVALACFIFGGNLAYQAVSKPILTLEDVQPLSLENLQPTKAWTQFEPSKIAELQAKGVPVFVDFTAKWCLICQANHLVLSVDKVDAKLQELGVVKMKADWTKHDPVITEELKKYGRNGVPLYLLFSGNPDEPPQVLPQVLTPDTILEYLDKVKPLEVIK